MYNRQEMRRALELREWARVRKVLDACAEPSIDVSQTLVEDTIHSGCLIEQRQQEKEIARRDELVRELRRWLEHSGDATSKERLDEHLGDVGLIERCYVEIRKALRACIMARRTPQEQAWAAISRLVEELKHLQAQLSDALASQKHRGTVWFLDSNPWHLTGPTGKPIDPDSVVTGVACHLALTLRMLAYENNWFSEKIVVLPSKIEVDEQIIFESGVNSLLAHSWGEVEDASEHLRFFGGQVSERRGLFRSPDEDTLLQADAVRFDLDFTLQQWEIVARKRLGQLSLQNFMNLRGYAELKSRIRNIQDGPVGPPPNSFVSEHEILTTMLLQMTHHLSPRELAKDYDGLTLSEWTRCYCVLRCYANPDGMSPALELQELNLEEFRKTLERAGIKAPKAQQFIDSIIFQTGKRDLYDAPVIADADGRHWFLAPLFASANVAEVVLSQLGSRHASFDSKGSAFEKTIRDAFQKRNIPVKGFKYHHDGKQYECDAAVFWGKHLFVFECKNDFLPTSRPRLSYFFWLDMINAASQVTTVASHFMENRSLIRRHFDRDDWQEIHPVVLSALPFSLPEQLEGAHFYDASALLRFLTDGSAGLAQQTPDNKLVLQAPLTQLWSGAEPIPEDLIAQIRSPIQLKQFRDRLQAEWFRNAVSPDFVVETPLLRFQPITPEQLLATFGHPEDSREALEEAISNLSKAIQKPFT
jgi:hypothetical protein